MYKQVMVIVIAVLALVAVLLYAFLAVTTSSPVLRFLAIASGLGVAGMAVFSVVNVRRKK